MSTYLPELILVTIEPKAKQLTNKLSEVTEFSTCNIQNQICKASCHTSKTIKRKKLWALLYEEIKPWQWNRAARENMITFRYWKGHLWAVFYAEKKCFKGDWGETPNTPHTVHYSPEWAFLLKTHESARLIFPFHLFKGDVWSSRISTLSLCGVWTVLCLSKIWSGRCFILKI